MLVRKIAIISCTVLATGCSYTSQYVAPRDGRARVIWSEGEPIALLPDANPDCEREVISAMNARRAEPEYALIDDPTVVIEGNLVLRFGHAGADPRHHEVGRVVRARELPKPARKSAPAAHPDKSQHATKSGNPAEPREHGQSSSAGWIAVAGLLAIVVTPVLTFALIASQPVQGATASPAMDAVNAYNDLARTSGSPCAQLAIPAGAAQ